MRLELGFEESGRFERGEGMAANGMRRKVHRQESFGLVYRGQ